MASPSSASTLKQNGHSTNGGKGKGRRDSSGSRSGSEDELEVQVQQNGIQQEIDLDEEESEEEEKPMTEAHRLEKTRETRATLREAVQRAEGEFARPLYYSCSYRAARAALARGLRYSRDERRVERPRVRFKD